MTDELKAQRLAALQRAKAAQLEAAAKRKAEGLSARLTPIEHLKRRPQSLRLAINAMCWDCEGRDEDPHVKWRIGNCLISHCPLYNVRPHQKLHGTPTPASLKDAEP